MQTCDKCREVVLTCAFKSGSVFSSVKGIVIALSSWNSWRMRIRGVSIWFSWSFEHIFETSRAIDSIRLGSGFWVHLSSIHSVVIFAFACLMPWQDDKRSSLGVVLMETLCVCLVEKMFTNLRKGGWRKTQLCDYQALLVQKVDSAIQHSHNCSYKAFIF